MHTSFLLDSLSAFDVADYCSLLSDAHCPISVNLEIDIEHKNNKGSLFSTKASWIVKQWDEQTGQINLLKIKIKILFANLMKKLNSMLQSEFVEQNDIADIVQDI